MYVVRQLHSIDDLHERVLSRLGSHLIRQSMCFQAKLPDRAMRWHYRADRLLKWYANYCHCAGVFEGHLMYDTREHLS